MNSCGVIIARFQVHQLHQAHKDLIEQVLSKHKTVIVFLGVSPILGSKRNPLDFNSRRLMLHEEYGNRLTILPMRDQPVDSIWSKEIDKRIREVYPSGDAILYGSRDSFIPHYKGSFKTIELESKTIISGTEIRKDVSEETLSDPKFRAGIIYALYNTYPTVYSTVDVAILNSTKTEILLGKKPNELKYRFIGGFVDPTDESDQNAVRRETYEETGIEIDNIQYVCSQRVDDWRYRKEESKIMTRLFEATYISGKIQPADDISELKWFNITELNISEIVNEHQALFQNLLKYLSIKNS